MYSNFENSRLHASCTTEINDTSQTAEGGYRDLCQFIFITKT